MLREEWIRPEEPLGRNHERKETPGYPRMRLTLDHGPALAGKLISVEINGGCPVSGVGLLQQDPYGKDLPLQRKG